MTEIKFRQDKNFEECICQALISDHPFAEQMVEVLNVEYFNIEYLKEITKLIFAYYFKYKIFPSFKILGSVILNETPDGVLKDQMKGYMMKIHKDPLNGDIEYVKETVLDFCRKRSLAIAMENSLALIEERKYEQISLEIKKALQAGSERSVGHEYRNHFDARMQQDVYVNILPTPWEEMNKIIRCGGLAGGKVGVVAAGTGIGKSHYLVDIGAHALRLGKNGVHYALEDGDIDTGRRYDANISGISIDNLGDHIETVRQKMEEVKGTLVIKSYPAGTASVMTLKNHFNHLIMRGVRPDFIIIDYAELLRSSESNDTKRFNIEAVFREIVAWSQEIKVPIWTAAQINREGMDADVVTHKHLHECYAIAQIVHLFVTINRKKDGPSPEIGNAFIAKSKISKDGVVFVMMINTGTSRIELLPNDSDVSGGGGDGDSEENEMSRLRQKFKDFQRKHSSSPSLN